VAEVWDALPQARIVGGAVRDGLAGRAVADVDFAAPLEPDVVTARLRAAGIEVVPTGVKHGTRVGGSR
jgi:tRNA nucleotidyltransferase/poly(A) polymerase